MLIIQLTGMSGSGKTTLAVAVAKRLLQDNLKVEILDGDEVRKTICKDLSYSKNDRCENIRRIGYIANLLAKNGVISIIAAINPYEDIRNEICSRYYNVSTIWIKCKLKILIRRDTKGLYKRALLSNNQDSKIYNLSGINDIYEEPKSSDLIIDTSTLSENECVIKLYNFIKSKLQEGVLKTVTASPYRRAQ